LIAGLRERIPVGGRPFWDVLAPPSTNLVPDPIRGRRLAQALAEAAVRADPGLDPRAALTTMRVPVVLIHGRHDTLVPFTETLRLARTLPASSTRMLTITRLFGHTKTGEATALWNPCTLAREAWAFAATMREVVRVARRS
jgi:pimeloyl-ACP methyl ester carboxylesterase